MTAPALGAEGVKGQLAWEPEKVPKVSFYKFLIILCTASAHSPRTLQGQSRSCLAAWTEYV